MDRQMHREMWDFLASEEGQKFLPYTTTKEWLQIKQNKKKIKKGTGISTIWIKSKERTNYSKFDLAHQYHLEFV